MTKTFRTRGALHSFSQGLGLAGRLHWSWWGPSFTGLVQVLHALIGNTPKALLHPRAKCNFPFIKYPIPPPSPKMKKIEIEQF